MESKGRGVNLVPRGGGTAIWAIGDLCTFKAVAEDTGGAFASWEETVPPQGGPPPHVHHNEDEAFYVLKGEVEFLGDGSATTLSDGAFAHVPKGTLHAFRNVGTGPARLLIMVTPAGFEGFFFEVGEPATPGALPPPPSGPPDVQGLAAVARKYGMEIPPPPGP